MGSIWFRCFFLVSLGIFLGVGSNFAGPKSKRVPWMRGSSSGLAQAGVENGDVSTAAMRLFSEKIPANILDARRKEDYLKGHIKTALSFDVRQFDVLFPEIQKKLEPFLDRPIVIYCNGGDCEDSHNLAEKLKAFGLEPLIYTGGWEAWTTAGMPVETGESP